MKFKNYDTEKRVKDFVEFVAYGVVSVGLIVGTFCGLFYCVGRIIH